MLSRLSLSIFLLAPLLTFGCSHSEKPMALAAMKPEAPKDPRWTDLGILTVDDDVNLAMTENYLYAQAGKSIYRKAVQGKSVWTLLKTFDDQLSYIYAISGSPDTLLASVDESFENLPLRASHDGGTIWESYGREFTENPEAVGSEYELPKHYFRDSGGKLYASLSGPNTVVSSDLGKTWSYIHGKPGLHPCYNGIATVVPGVPNLIFKGQECPLDEAWIGTFDVANSESAMDKLVSAKILGNQRPNTFASSSLLPGQLLVGVEGGLLRYNVQTRAAEWLLTAGHAEDGESYGTVEPKDTQWDGSFTHIWIDPSNPQHFVASGLSKGGTVDFLVFETNDAGKTFQSLRPPTDPNGLSKSNGGVSLGQKLLVAAREGEKKVRVWLVDLSHPQKKAL